MACTPTPAASDGQYTPTELVGLAKARRLSVLAVADHDTIAGVAEAQKAGTKLGMTVIRGVELSAKDYPNCHILGYGFRDGETGLVPLCEKFWAGQDKRKHKIVDFLREESVNIDLAEVETMAGEVIARPHFTQVMMKHGYVPPTEMPLTATWTGGVLAAGKAAQGGR